MRARIEDLLVSSPVGSLLAEMRANGAKMPWYLAWLERTQWASPARLHELQDERLRRVIGYAYEHSAFYRMRLDAVGFTPERFRGVDDLQSLPVLTRGDVREHFSEIKADNANHIRHQLGTTSGTSGARLEFLRDVETMQMGNAVQWRYWRWHGIRFHHRFAQLSTVGSAESRGAPPVQYSRGSRRLTLRLRSLDSESLGQAIDRLARFQPDAIRCGSTTLLTHVASYVMRHQPQCCRPKAVFAGGERVFPDQREIVHEAFGVPLVEFYGNWEYVVFGGECERGRLHLAPEMGCVEILKDGRPQPPGETGEIVVTSLWNRAFPFIRYAIGDVGRLEGEPCPCGRGLPTWRIVGGRQKDLLATPVGYLHLSGSLLGTPRWRGKIQGLRFYQETRSDVLVQIVKGPDFRNEDVPALREDIDRCLEGRLAFTIQFCEGLADTPGGKYRYIVSKVPIEI